MASKKKEKEILELNIREFPLQKKFEDQIIRDLKRERSGGMKCVIIGKPGTGKSTLITDIAFSVKHLIPVAEIFSGTEEMNHEFEKIFPPLFIHSGLNIDAIKELGRRQKISKEYLKNPWALNIIDDCTDDPALYDEQIFRELYKNGRHWSILHLLSMQYCMDVKPWLRTCIDYTFILREPTFKTRKKLYENFASSIDTFQDFCSLMDQITDDHTALVIDNRVQSNNYEECIFYYKASTHEDFKFGSPEYWKYNQEYYNKSYTPPY